MKPTITSRRPAATSASRIRSQASRVVASGFSQKTCLPAAMLGQHELLVGRPPRGHDDRVDLGILDQVLTGLVQLRAGQPVRDGLGAFQVGIGHRGDTGPREDVREPADVVLADHPDTDDADVHCHD